MFLCLPSRNAGCLLSSLEDISHNITEIQADFGRVSFEDAIVFVDDLEHCRNAGEIEIPLKQGTLSEDRICGELGDLILGKAAGRKSDTDITVFDSTGMALLDLAVADFLLKKNM